MNRLIVIENFYNNPEFVTTLGEFQQGGCGGVYSERSKPLNEINKEFHNGFSSAICSILQLDISKVHVHSFLSRQTFNEKSSGGFIHIDGRNSVTGQVANYNSYSHLYGGTIFLSTEYDRTSGINFYDDVTEETAEQKFDCAINSLYNVRDSENFSKLKSQYDSRFELSAFVGNVYNRLVIWKCGYPHNSVITKSQGFKLSHNFYISLV